MGILKIDANVPDNNRSLFDSPNEHMIPTNIPPQPNRPLNEHRCIGIQQIEVLYSLGAMHSTHDLARSGVIPHSSTATTASLPSFPGPM